ncbi:DNA-processing protein DprA [Mucilaginibacter terrenus]|uniref:DNA-processing protein DprA n=1 Tax=Mucilaginibacter terrenus TaxID=2482727 RepID=A0A3E2NWC0_9SPHI|nr:DNA-processing protein DprA [Mucilaginibacter terrenus]RFZ85259.1 DNA-processing protein DprA [Mucilaginibacter terrenus]
MITERTKAILLFTSYLSKDLDKENKPLSLTEWNKLVKWLQQKNIFPEAFLSGESFSLINSWNDQSISRNRLAGLLERKTALAIALDKWSRAGVWIISRGDRTYPQVLKDRLKGAAPNILFGIGDQSIMNGHFVGVIGSRNASDEDLHLSENIGLQINQQNFGIVSGGAKGVDEAAMLGALKSGGKSVGFLADSLIKKSTSSTFRNYIIKNQLVLISPYNPEASFNAGNAMGRNKLIYAFSKASIVVISDVKGGTWEGAKENLKNNWTKLWVCQSTTQGNKEIVKLGGRWLSDSLKLDVKHLVTNSIEHSENLFSTTAELKSNEQKNDFLSDSIPEDIKDKSNKQTVWMDINTMTSFDFFLLQWFGTFGASHINKLDLCDKFQLTLKQVEVWLDLAVCNEIAVKVKDNKKSTWALEKQIKLNKN